MEKTTLIKEIPLFSGLDKGAVNSIEKIFREKRCGRGEILFSEGDPSDSFFILVEGAVDLIKSSPDGKEQLIRSVEPGESFAEAAMFSGETYPATAISRSGSTLLIIKKTDFLKFIQSNPEVSLKMMGSMSKLLRHLNQLVADLSLSSVPKRLAAFLLKRHKETGTKRFELGIKKQDLAFRLGTISETLSRTLKKFSDQRIIEVKRDQIVILDLEILEELST